MSEKKQNNELDLEQMNEVSGGIINQKQVVDRKGFLGIGRKTHTEFQAEVNGMKGGWTRDLATANNQENELIKRGLK